ncbi:hypothetical protein VULLAG_LOCUS5730 [Vulpes lagopus]
MPLAAPRTLADPQSPEPPSSPLGAPCTPADLQPPCAPQQPPRPPALHSPLCPPRPLGTPLGAPAGPCTPTVSRRPRRHPPPVPSRVPPLFRIPASLRPPAGAPESAEEKQRFHWGSSRPPLSVTVSLWLRSPSLSGPAWTTAAERGRQGPGVRRPPPPPPRQGPR